MTIAKTYPRCSFETQVSNYDRLAGWLTASIVVLGALLLIFATLLLRERSAIRLVNPRPVEPTTPLIAGDLDTEQLVDPGTEAPELVSEIIDISQFDTDVLGTALARSSQLFRGTGDTPGDGDGRIVGPPGPHPPNRLDHVSQRWEIAYELSDLKTYSEQLRFFGIELGLVSQNTNDIWRIADIGRQNRLKESSRNLESTTVYFISSNSRMARWDKYLSETSGVESQGCDLKQSILVHFYPAETVERLKTLEQSAIPAGKSLEQVKQTNFRLVSSDDGFEFEVTKIKFD
jgi:hypothetical protein